MFPGNSPSPLPFSQQRFADMRIVQYYQSFGAKAQAAQLTCKVCGGLQSATTRRPTMPTTTHWRCTTRMAVARAHIASPTSQTGQGAGSSPFILMVLPRQSSAISAGCLPPSQVKKKQGRCGDMDAVSLLQCHHFDEFIAVLVSRVGVEVWVVVGWSPVYGHVAARSLRWNPLPEAGLDSCGVASIGMGKESFRRTRGSNPPLGQQGRVGQDRYTFSRRSGEGPMYCGSSEAGIH